MDELGVQLLSTGIELTVTITKVVELFLTNPGEERWAFMHASALSRKMDELLDQHSTLALRQQERTPS